MTLGNRREKRELIPVALMGVSVLLAVMVLVKVTSFLATTAKAENMVRIAEMRAGLDGDDMEVHLAESKAVADGLKKKNLFAPPPPRQHPVKAVIGILGKAALINDKWYRVGDRVGDAKVVAIEATQVRIEWDGKETTFAPITSSGPSGPGGRGQPGPRSARGGQGPAGPPTVVAEPGAGQMPGPPGFGDRFMMMRERFMNMSEAERAEFRERMRERFGDRGAGGGRGPRGGRGEGERGEGRGRGSREGR